MTTEKIKAIFDDFVKNSLNDSAETSAFVKYAEGVAQEMVPIVNSYNLKDSDIEFGYFCAYFHKANKVFGISATTDSDLFGTDDIPGGLGETSYVPDALLTGTFPENAEEYRPIFRTVIESFESVAQPDITDPRVGTFVHLLRDSIFLYRERIARNERVDGVRSVNDVLSPAVINKISYGFPILPEDVVTEADKYAEHLASFLSVVYVATKDIIEDNSYFTDLCATVAILDRKSAEYIGKLTEKVKKHLETRESIVAYRNFETVKRFRFPLGIKIAGIIIALIALAGLALMGISMNKVSRLPEWKAIKETGRTNEFFKNSFSIVFGRKELSFSTNYDSSVKLSLLGIDSLCQTGKPISAINTLVERLKENSNDLDSAAMLMDLSMRYGFYDIAVSCFNTFLADKEATPEDVDRINGYLDKLDEYYLTYDTVEEIIHETPYDKTKDDFGAYISSISGQIGDLLNKQGYDRETVYENLLPMATSESEVEKYSQKLAEINPYNVFPLYTLAASYRRTGRIEEALSTIAKAYKINSEDPDLLRIYGTIETVVGNKEKALEYSKAAYDLFPDGEYIAEAYLIALTENGQKAEAEALFTQLQGKHEFEPDFAKYRNGELSAYDYYVEKEDK